MLRTYLILVLRHLVRHKGYALVNIIGLAGAMACCVIMLSYVRYELNYDLFHENADRIYRVVQGNKGQHPAALGPTMHRELPDVVGFTRFLPPAGSWVMAFEDQVYYEDLVYWADAETFDIFTFPFVTGDPETALDEPFSVVITRKTAEKYFDRENPLGKVITGDYTFDLTVTGVIEDLPSDAHFDAHFFISILTRTRIYYETVLERWTDARYFTYVLLAQGVSPETVEESLPDLVGRHIEPNMISQSSAYEPYYLQPLVDIHLNSHLDAELGNNSDAAYVYLLLSGALFVFIIGCFNFINLITARMADRVMEIGLRKALGARRYHVVLQFLTESVVLAGSALVLCVVLLVLFLPTGQLFGLDLRAALAVLDMGSLSWLLTGAVIAVSSVAGFYAYFFLAGINPANALRGIGKDYKKKPKLRRVLIVTQFAVSLVLFICTMVTYRQSDFLQQKHLGFDKNQLLVINASIGGVQDGYPVFKQMLSQDPSILGVTESRFVPGISGGRGILNTLVVRPREGSLYDQVDIGLLSVEPGFIATLGIELLAGRSFSNGSTYNTDGNQGVVINETSLQRLGWDDPSSALDKQLVIGENWVLTVVGIVEDFHLRSLHHEIEPLMIVPGNQLGQISIRFGVENMTDATGAVENAWRTIYPDYPLAYSLMKDDFDRLYEAENRLGILLGIYAIVAGLIAFLGLLGLASLLAERRMHEIAIRKALGASVIQVVLLMLKDPFLLVLAANCLAWPIAYFATNRWLRDFAYRIDIDFYIFIYSGLSALLIALLTVGYLSVKTAMANPIDALRYR